VDEAVRQFLSGEGPIAAALGGDFEPRPEQLAMAEGVGRAFEGRSHLVVEAGTGVGKSFAYLVPAMLRCLLGEKVVIATNTIALQEQLVNKDVPLLKAALARWVSGEQGEIAEELKAKLAAAMKLHPIQPVLVKGRGNYVSVRRLKMASERQERLLADPAARRSLHVIEDWAYSTTDGTLSTLPQLERPGVWDKVQSDSGNCMGRKCPEFGKCFYQAARRKMEEGNLLICNHALYFSDLALRAKEVGFLPEYQHVVLDEAHNVEDVAAEHFGVSLSEGRVMHLLTTLYQARSGKGYLPHLQLQTGDFALIDGAVRLVLAAENASRAFFEDLVRFSKSPEGRSGRIRRADVVVNELSGAMRELALRLRAIRESIKNDPDRFELNAYALRASSIADEAEILVQQTLEGCAYWVEVGGDPDGGGLGGRGFQRVTMACSPIEVAPVLKEKLFGDTWSVVLTSATLADGKGRAPADQQHAGSGGFGHIQARLGCENAATLKLGSPFDHSSQVELFIEKSMPRPEGGVRGRPPSKRMAPDEFDQRSPFDDESAGTGEPRRAETYEDILTARIIEHVDATDGGAFILFTSFATLHRVAELLRPELSARGMPMYVQGRDGSRMQILERFREDERSVLLGAASFWQGVDVRGRGLRNVIITRLPFEPPDRPLTEARIERITQRGGDAFFEDSLPRAVIRFKQGFGRLIRSRSDHGRVVVLDPRIVTTGYGRRFLDALPDGVRVITR
jgi:ATP-dependent DNA helicase DinG